MLAPVEEQALVGLLTALLITLAELVVVVIRREPEEAGLAQAGFVLAAFQLPIGWAIGALLGAILALGRATPWLRWIRVGAARIVSPRRDPNAFAGVIATGIGTLAFAFGAFRSLSFFSSHFHSEGLIRIASVASLPVVLAIAVLVAAAASLVLRRVAPLFGPFASPLGAVALGVGAAAPLVWRARRQLRDLGQGLDPLPYLWPIGCVLLFLLVAVVVRRWIPLRVHRLSWWLAAAACLSLWWVSNHYGGGQPERQLVEQRSVQGTRLLRFYARLSDRDRDGFSSGFGGGDCDDSDATVYPGADDPPGDGIDGDCFEGDGSPTLEDALGDGHYTRAPATTRRRSVVLVTVDALRPDHLGVNGYERPTSPSIDAFAAQSAVFTETIAPSSRSVRSIPSMFMGVYPSQIVYGNEYLYPGVRPENDLFAEVAKRAGYVTHACVGTDYFHRVRDFFQGFDQVEQPKDAPRDFPVDCALRALPRLAEGDQPFLLWVHLFNVHLPYLPDRLPSLFGAEPKDHYDTEITLADREFQRLLSALDGRGLSRSTVVVLASDHGEAFMEHGHRGHSRTLFEEEVRSVLMLRGPGIPAGRIDATVSLMDLTPTLRNLLDLPGRPQIPGRSLVPLMLNESEGWPDRPLFMELLPDGLFPYDQKAVRDGRYKLIWWVRDNTLRLSDLQEDPREMVDVSAAHPEETQRLHTLIRSWMAGHRAGNRRSEIVAQNLLPSVPPMQHRVDARYPGFTLLGYDMPRDEIARNETLPMTFYYRVDRRIDGDWFFFVDLIGPNGVRFHDFHAHHYPLNGAYRTDEWEPGQIIRDPVEIYAPRDAPIGNYRIDFSLLDDDRRPIAFGPQGRYNIPMGQVRVRP